MAFFNETKHLKVFFTYSHVNTLGQYVTHAFFPFEIAVKAMYFKICRKSVSYTLQCLIHCEPYHILCLCSAFLSFMGVAYHCRYKPFLLTVIYLY